MTMLKAAIALGALAIPVMTFAHPLDTPFASRGECESALAQANHDDGAVKVENGEFEDFGESNRWMHDTFHCERIGQAWFIVRESGA
jgi:hypothetical protein